MNSQDPRYNVPQTSITPNVEPALQSISNSLRELKETNVLSEEKLNRSIVAGEGTRKDIKSFADRFSQLELSVKDLNTKFDQVIKILKK